MRGLQASENRTKELIHKTDKYRADYYKYYTRGKNWKGMLNYDLMINGYKVGRDDCVKLIKEYLNMKIAASDRGTKSVRVVAGNS